MTHFHAYTLLGVLAIALLVVLWPLIRPARRRQDTGAVARAVARHPSSRKRAPGLPRDGTPLSADEYAVLIGLEFSAPDEWDVLAAEAEQFSADRDKRGDR